MAYENKPLFGSLFPNDRKTAENQPDLTGTIMLPDGKLMRLAGWHKTGWSGAGYISLKLSEFGEAKRPAQHVEPVPPKPTDPNDDIPF